MPSFTIKNALVLGLLALGAAPNGALGHSEHHHHDDDGEEIVLTDSKKEELLMKWEQEVGVAIFFPNHGNS